MRTLLSCMKSRHGSAVLEFAVILPFFVFLLIGSVELSRFIIINQKLEATSTTLADLATQGSNISRTSLKQVANAANIMMNPYSAGSTSVVFSSAATQRNPQRPCRRRNQPCITWQYEPMGADRSRIGSAGGAPSLPNRYVVQSGQNVIVAEMFYHFKPLFAITANLIPALNNRTLYYPAVYKPRQGALTTLN